MRPLWRVAVGLLLTFTLAACPGRDPLPEPSRSPSATPTESIQARGQILVAYPWEPPTLNPFVRAGDAPAVRELVAPMLPPLHRALPGGKTQPWLLDKVISEDSSQIRFTLRSDAVWSDAVPITSADVAFTWRTIMDRRWPIASRAGYDALSAVETPDPKTVVLRFARSYPQWRDLFSGGLGVLPAHKLKDIDFGKALQSAWPVSGGPYILTQYTRGLELIFEANPRAWQEIPRTKTVRVQFVPDSTTALALFKAGKTDVLGPYSTGDFARRARLVDGAAVTTDTGATWSGIVLKSTSGVLADARVRSAVALATDRDRLVATLVRAEGERLHAAYAQPRVDAAAVAYDAAAAAALLREAGFTQRRGGTLRKGSTELAISLASPDNDDLAARLIRGLYYQLREAGFDVNLVELEYEQLWRDWLPSGRMQAAFVRFADPPAGSAAVAAQSRPESTVIPLYRATVSAVARKGVSGVQASAAADGFLALAAAWQIA